VKFFGRKRVVEGHRGPDLAAVTRARRTRFNPLTTLTGESLARALDGFESGYLHEAAYLWEQMARRDDVLSGVKAKREKTVAHRELRTMAVDDSPEAKEQRAVLEYLWSGARAENAYDRNERGGVQRLIRQQMQAVSFRYAAHHLVFDRQAGGVTAKFEFVPLWFFENTEGALRFVESGTGSMGEELDPAEWMLTCGDGLMESCSVAYFAKRLVWQDLLAFCEKFGMPGVLGRTNAAEGSAAGQAVAAAVERFASDFAGVLYNDDGSGKLELITAQATGTVPMAEVIDRIDRKMSALYRGADLSTMSAGAGSGEGASLQEQEGDILEVDDAAMVSESLQEVERTVLESIFGEGVRVKAYSEVVIPNREDLQGVMAAIDMLVRLGAPVGADDAMERLGFARPGDDEELLEAAPAGGELGGGWAMNARAAGNTRRGREEFMREARRMLSAATREDMAGLAAEVEEMVRDIDDPGEAERALRGLLEKLPEYIEADERTAEAWAGILASSVANGFGDLGTGGER
jgi:phage gp29-like protein